MVDCKQDEVINPLTGRCIKQNSKLYKDLVSKGVIVDNNNNKKCKEHQIINPITGRCINKNGELYKKIFKNGDIGAAADVEKENGNKNKKKDKTDKTKKCKENQVLNNKTKRCINIGTTLYLKALKNGWLNNLVLVDDGKSMEKSKGKCKNTTTYIYNNPINQVPGTDILRTNSGFCFSSSELVEWLNSNTFDDINPYEPGKKILNEIDINSNSELEKAVSTYLNAKLNQHTRIVNFLSNNIDKLYAIGKAGRICSSASITSSDAESEPFEEAIEALVELSSLCKKNKILSEINNPANPKSSNIQQIIEDANLGRVCIHGAGLNLIGIFVEYFVIIEKNNARIEYNVEEVGLLFPTVNGSTTIVDWDCREYDIDSDRYQQWILPYVKNIPKVSKLRTDFDTKIKVYNKKCGTDPYMTTYASLDNWGNALSWTLLNIDGYCMDLQYIIRIIYDSINLMKNTNPYPQFPRHPYTQKLLTKENLLMIKRRIINNSVDIPKTLKLFFDKGINLPEHSSAQLLKIFSKRFKYVRYFFDGDDENNFVGVWCDKRIAVSTQELQANFYLRSCFYPHDEYILYSQHLYDRAPFLLTYPDKADEYSEWHRKEMIKIRQSPRWNYKDLFFMNVYTNKSTYDGAGYCNRNNTSRKSVDSLLIMK